LCKVGCSQITSNLFEDVVYWIYRFHIISQKENVMSYKVLFVLNAVVVLVFGLGFLFRPDFVLPLFGVTERYASTLWASRFFGSALFALGLILWFAKDAEERVQKGISWGMFISTLVGLVLAIVATFSSTAVLRQNTWIPILIYVLFALGYGLMLFLKPRMREMKEE